MAAGPIRATHVFLDVDGTLVDLRAAFGAGTAAAAGRLSEVLDTLVTPAHVATTREQVAVEPAFRGQPPAAIRAESMRRILATGGREDALAEVVEAYLDARNRGLAPYEDVDAPLEELHARGFVLVAATNGDVDLSSLAFGRLLHATYLAAEAGVAKPDPRFFLGAMAKVGAAPETSVMVGDRLDNDVEPAVRVGMAGVLLDREGRLSDPAVRTIRSLRELPGILKRA